MSEHIPPLTPGARSLLDAARDGDEPRSGERERVRARVLAAIAAGAATSAAGGKAAASAAGGGGAAGGAVTIKMALLAIAVAGVAAGAYVGLRSKSSGPAPVAVPEPEPAPSIAPPPVEPTTPAVVDEAIEIAAEDVPDVPSARPHPRKPERPPALSPADSLREERALIARASDALRAGDARAALKAVSEHQRRFPDGLLIEERSAARVQALCAAGRTADGASAREAFLARWPRSVHAAKVRAACAK